MKTTHTPGPWEVRCHDMVYAGTRLVADCENLDKSKRPAPPIAEDMANAALIAAAPDLLAALERIERCAGNYNPKFEMGAGYYAEFSASMDQVRAAISKATGKVAP